MYFSTPRPTIPGCSCQTTSVKCRRVSQSPTCLIAHNALTTGPVCWAAMATTRAATIGRWTLPAMASGVWEWPLPHLSGKAGCPWPRRQVTGSCGAAQTTSMPAPSRRQSCPTTLYQDEWGSTLITKRVRSPSTTPKQSPTFTPSVEPSKGSCTHCSPHWMDAQSWQSSHHRIPQYSEVVDTHIWRNRMQYPFKIWG